MKRDLIHLPAMAPESWRRHEQPARQL